MSVVALGTKLGARALERYYGPAVASHEPIDPPSRIECFKWSLYIARMTGDRIALDPAREVLEQMWADALGVELAMWDGGTAIHARAKPRADYDGLCCALDLIGMLRAAEMQTYMPHASNDNNAARGDARRREVTR